MPSNSLLNGDFIHFCERGSVMAYLGTPLEEHKALTSQEVVSLLYKALLVSSFSLSSPHLYIRKNIGKYVAFAPRGILKHLVVVRAINQLHLHAYFVATRIWDELTGPLLIIK